MAKALGQLPNAPLIYVLAQIRFTLVPRMDRRQEDFHEKVFQTYPRSEKERIDQFSIKDGQPELGNSIHRWHFINETRDTGIILDSGMLVLHTTDYETSKTFFAVLEEALNALLAVIPEQGVSFKRLGLRYVDLLCPEGGMLVDQQVIDALKLPTFTESIGEAQRMEQIITCQSAVGGTLNIRHRQSSSPDLLPSDLFPNKLELAPRLKRERQENTIDGLLDYDHFIEDEKPFDIETIIKMFRCLHAISSDAFKETTTKDALTYWRKEIEQ